MCIMIIDDDVECCNTLKTFLEYERFRVYFTLTSVEGLHLMRQLDPALVILDVRMPEMHGWEVCRRIRSFSGVPILMISAYFTQVSHIVQGLDLGADDYLAKPLDFDLLRAKVKVLLRRKSKIARQERHQTYTDSYLSVDLYCQQARVQGRSVSLYSLQYQLLEILVTNIDQVVPSIEIIEELWPDADYLADTFRNRLYSCIKSLKQAIEPEPGAPIYIVSEHGLGYRFVSWV